MITSKKMKKKFEDYRNWFFTFLAKEYLNLPINYQRKFLDIARKFIENCEKVHEEAKNIKEKTFIIYIKEIEPARNKKCVIIGKVLEINKDIRIGVPAAQVPEVGESIECVLFSLDEELWYSSKEALITGR